MRQSATILIVGFVLIVIFLIYLMQSMAVVQRVAVIDAVQGPADVKPHDSDRTVPAEVGQLVRVGDTVRTGAGASVELRWARMAGGMRVKLGPDTSFVVNRATANRSSGVEDSRLGVHGGTVWIRLRKALKGKSKFEVETPTAVAAVRGTVFRVSVLPDGSTAVSVWEGAVSLKPGHGKEVMVEAGASAQFRPRDGSLLEMALTPEETEDWAQQTSIVGPFLLVEEPADGAALRPAEWSVSGRVEPDSRVFVDGAPAVVTKEGTFTQPIALRAGENVIEVKAVAPDGAETVVTRTVVVEAGE
jgi:hypothetical protein